MTIGVRRIKARGPTRPKARDPRTPRKRAAYVWNDPSVPPELHEAFRPMLPDDEMAKLSSESLFELEKARQTRIAAALDLMSRSYLEEVARHRAYFEGAAVISGQLGPDADVGRAVREGGRKGNVKAHGSPQSRRELHARLVADIERLLAEPGRRRSVAAITNELSKTYGMHAKSILRVYKKAQKKMEQSS